MSYGQDTREVTRFLGIPVDGTRAEMVSKLKAKGFTIVPGMDGVLEGEFNGKDSYISIQTNNRKVWRINVMDKNGYDETNIKINFNELCRQFEENAKYVGDVGQIISESEDIDYELDVNNKRYQAVYYQKPQVGDSTTFDYLNRQIWFMIGKVPFTVGEYKIYLYYENLYNKADGEDL